MASDPPQGQAHGVAQVVGVERVGFLLQIDHFRAAMRGRERESHLGDIDQRPGRVGRVNRQQRTPSGLGMHRQGLEARGHGGAVEIGGAHQRSAARRLDIAFEGTQLTGIEGQISYRESEVAGERRGIRQAGAPGGLRGEARQIHRRAIDTADDLLRNQGREAHAPRVRRRRVLHRGSRP